MREKKIETYLFNEMKRIGGICYKFISPGHCFVPDRICIFPGGFICFVETKAPGEKPSIGQVIEHEEIRARNAQVYVIDTKEKVDKFIRRFS